MKSLPWYIKAICICVMIFTLSISFDLIGAKEKNTVIDNLEISELVSQTNQGRYYTTGYLSKVTCEDLFFTVKTKRNYLQINDTIFVKYTPLYKWIGKLNLYRSGKIFDKSPPEGTFILLHTISFLIFSCCSIVLYINCYGKSTEILMTFGVLFLILMYFFFGTGNYFEPYN